MRLFLCEEASVVITGLAAMISFGMAVISVSSYFKAKERETKPHKIIFRHRLIAALAIIGSCSLREVGTGFIAKFG
jgi:hypothetical protein